MRRISPSQRLAMPPTFRHPPSKGVCSSVRLQILDALINILELRPQLLRLILEDLQLPLRSQWLVSRAHPAWPIAPASPTSTPAPPKVRINAAPSPRPAVTGEVISATIAEPASSHRSTAPRSRAIPCWHLSSLLSNSLSRADRHSPARHPAPAPSALLTTLRRYVTIIL